MDMDWPRLEALKQEGNQCVAAGRHGDAISAYSVALDLLAPTPGVWSSIAALTEGDGKLKSVAATLLSNLSHVHILCKDYDRSALVAQLAVDVDPTASKAWFRLVRSRHLSGYSFDAFVTLRWKVRPHVRWLREAETTAAEVAGTAAPGSLTASQASALLDELEPAIHRAIGLADVLPHFELVDCGTGVTMVSRAHIPLNRVVFVESRLLSQWAMLNGEVHQHSSTESLITYFASHFREHQRHRDAEWEQLVKEMTGTWPRHAKDVLPKLREHVEQVIRAAVGPISVEDLDELSTVALQCRYNCFHSGFFRTCALANHSCEANIAMKYDPAQQVVTLIAVRPIAPGDVMCVKYLSDIRFVMGVGGRQEYLRHSWLFWCDCTRCVADCQPTATAEQVSCRACGAYVHLPLSGLDEYGELVEEEEQSLGRILREAGGGRCPLLADSSTCGSCGAIQTWMPEERAVIMEAVSRWMTLEPTSFADLTRLAASERRQLQPRCHRDHWLHRLLLYRYCEQVRGPVMTAYRSLQQPEGQVPNATVTPFLESFGFHPQPMDHHGGDALAMLVELWRLISPFYPPYEGWVLHLAICQLTLFSLILPDHPAALCGPQALQLLRDHGRYLTSQDVAQWVHLYKLRRPSAAPSGTKPPTLKEVRATLSGV